MDLAHQVLPSQRYSPSRAYSYDARHEVPSIRQPLRESTGNAQHQPQHQSLGSLELCSQGLTGIPTLPSSIPTPPIVPTQSLGSPYGSASSGLRLRRQQLRVQKRSRRGVNPIYLSPEFKQYRLRQAEKDAQIWPDVLEEAFLDALLLVPHMGRRKFSMRDRETGSMQLFGRNMLISEYLWIAYCNSLPPGATPDKEKMWRHRKQVSSHIQVLKGFFLHHRCYHFFFGKEEKENAKPSKDKIGAESFKTNPVLVALSQGRLPEVRPNYDYLAQLLASDSLVTVRPKTCWIYVFNKKIRDDVEGLSESKTYHETEGVLDKADFPHRYKFLSGVENWAGREKDDRSIRGTLLHEYTWNMKQVESSCVRDVSQDWERDFPKLNELLETASQDTRCDILHMHVRLDLHTVARLPEASGLSCLVKITIAQPALQGHRWRVLTRLARPPELCNAGEPALLTTGTDIGEIFQHKPGCDDENPNCDCRHDPSRRRGDACRIPFPAHEWASTLALFAHYPAYPAPQGSRSKRAIKREDEDAASGDELTQMELVKQIAMFQELWSCPPGATGNDRQGWTRRAVLLWTFETTHAWKDGKHDEVVVQSPGTDWRFLTAVDPQSPSHLQQMIVSPTSNPLARDNVMSPTPDYHQHLSAAMSENLNSAWDSAWAGDGSHHPTTVGPYGHSISVLDSYHNGLATPPPTAALRSSYGTDTNSYDVGGVGVHGHHDLENQELNYLAATAAGSRASILAESSSVGTDTYLSAAPGAIGVYDDVQATWDGMNLGDMSQQSWASGYAQQPSAALDWHHSLAPGGGAGDDGSQEAKAPPAHMEQWAGPSTTPSPGGSQHQHQHHQQHHPHHSQQQQQHQAWNQPQSWMPPPPPGQHSAGSGWDENSMPQGPSGLSPLNNNRKRRADAIEDAENYPLTAVPKLGPSWDRYSYPGRPPLVRNGRTQ